LSKQEKNIKDVVRELRDELEDEADLYENAPCGYLSLLPDGTIVKINRTLLHWLGYEPDELLFKHKFQDIITVPGRIYFDTHHFPLLKMQGSVMELNYELLTSSETRIPVLINTTEVTASNGDTRLLRMTVMNITDRKRYETELLKARRREEEEKKRFRFMAEMTPAIIWTASASGIPDYVNARFAQYTGYPFRRSVLPSITIYNELKVLMEKWKNSVREGIELEMEIRLQSFGGDYQWFLLKAIPYHDDTGRLVKWFGTCTNIHQQRQMQERMDEFISIASHELKTPITSVKANLELLLLMEKDEQRRAFLQKAFSGSNKMLNLVNALLDVSKIQVGHIQLNKDKIVMDTTVENAVESIKAVYPFGKVNLTNKAPGTVIFADPIRIEQVIANLISNAIKYSPGSNRADITVWKQGREVVVSVRDYGIGIDQSKLDKIFNRFYRVGDKKNSNRFSGLGIGLYITQQIVLLHDGQIWVESKIGEGSVFYVSFPVLHLQ
jgi:PAS domain S-box-containing protein